jgi:ABC-type transporter Mla MlaB component
MVEAIVVDGHRSCYEQCIRESSETLTLRITPVPTDDPGTLRLEGRLRAEEVPELERSAEAGVQALDLEDLQSADEDGLAAIRRLRDRGVEIRNPSHYLAMLLS